MCWFLFPLTALPSVFTPSPPFPVIISCQANQLNYAFQLQGGFRVILNFKFL